MVHNLTHFEGGQGLVLPMGEPGRAGHPNWSQGINTSSSTRAMRIVLPMGMAIELLQNGNPLAPAEPWESMESVTNSDGSFTW